MEEKEEKYFGLGNDWRQLTGKYNSTGDRAVAGLKLMGKSLFNVGKFAVTEVAPGMIVHAGKQASSHLKKNTSSLNSEQIELLEKIIKNGEEMDKKRNL